MESEVRIREWVFSNLTCGLTDKLKDIDSVGYEACYGWTLCGGHGVGAGFGSGSGYECGCGDSRINHLEDFKNNSKLLCGINLFSGKPVWNIDNTPTLIYYIHGDMARGATLNSDLTTTSCFIVKGNGNFAHGETIKSALIKLQKKL